MKDAELDLVFLDIQMDDLTGIELLESVKVNAMVIFTTAYSSYALKAYEFNVVDYLLKPISQKRFLQAVDKAYNLKYPENKIKKNKTSIAHEKAEEPGFVFVKRCPRFR